MRAIYFISTILLYACQPDSDTVKSLVEDDKIPIEYPFVDLKNIIVSKKNDTLTFAVQFRNLADTIQYSNQNHVVGSLEYCIEVRSHMNDTCDFKLTLYVPRPDTSSIQKKAAFRTYIGKNAEWMAAKYIDRGRLHFYKRFEAPYLILSDTVVTIKVCTKENSNDLIKAIKNNLTVRVLYNWPDTTCQRVYWVDFLQDTQVYGQSDRGLSRTDCYAQGFVPGSHNDTTIATVPYDQK